MSKHVTIHDIAREAGVSAATVSYVVNNRPDKSISEETRQKVWQIVNLFNYKPSAFAKKLRSSPDAKLISVYTGENPGLLHKSEFMYVLEELHKTFPLDKYGLVLSGLPYRRLDNVDAIIAYDMDERSFTEIGQMNFVPLIAFDSLIPDTLFFKVASNYKKQKELADEYFNGDYTFVTLTPNNARIKDEIETVFSNTVFVNGINDLCSLSQSNVLTTSRVVKEYLSDTATNLLFPNDLMREKCCCLLSCIERVLKREPFDVDEYRV